MQATCDSRAEQANPLLCQPFSNAHLSSRLSCCFFCSARILAKVLPSSLSFSLVYSQGDEKLGSSRAFLFPALFSRAAKAYTEILFLLLEKLQKKC